MALREVDPLNSKKSNFTRLFHLTGGPKVDFPSEKYQLPYKVRPLRDPYKWSDIGAPINGFINE